MRDDAKAHATPPPWGHSAPLERTFLHFPGIGPSKERGLWQHGIVNWERLSHALRTGTAPRDLVSRGESKQEELFPELFSPTLDDSAREWLRVAEESRAAFLRRDHAYFLAGLPPAEHWRVLAGVLSDALYLDIETTGLSHHFSSLTVVGALFRGRFHQWVWPQSVEELAKLIEDAPVVVTFNGNRFDLPFLRSHLPCLPSPRAHIDLLPIAGGCDIEGGQKPAERHFDLHRDEAIREMDGYEAVILWCRGVYGDADCYRQLLYYNRTDVEMLPQLAARLCQQRMDDSANPGSLGPRLEAKEAELGHLPSNFRELRRSWLDRQLRLSDLLPRVTSTSQRQPVVVGIDLRGNPKNPTGWARCVGAVAASKILHTDDEIVEETLAAEPTLVSIDAPLCLPRGRVSVADDSPCRAAGGIVRDAERIMWARGIRAYPALIRHMQTLTARGIELTGRLTRAGIPVIESYPGAAQDVLGIPRKGVHRSLLHQGLREFGFDVPESSSHDELDAVTAALVGYFYLAGQYEALGADDEGHLIVPRAAGRRWPCPE